MAAIAERQSDDGRYDGIVISEEIAAEYLSVCKRAMELSEAIYKITNEHRCD